MSILGNRVVRTEDERMLTVGGTYVEDLPLDGAAHVVYVRSPLAHARITSIDTAEALDMPGVLKVVTASDVDLPSLPLATPNLNQAMGRPVIASDVVRFAGEPVAVVVAETREAAVDAVAGVFVDYEALPAVVDPEEALKDEVILFPEAGTNVSIRFDEEPVDDFFAGCDSVISLRVVNQRLAPSPLEVRAAAAEWSGGRLTFWTGTQRPHLVREYLANLLGLSTEEIRVVCPDVGGGFGAKGRPYPEELLLGWLARELGRPVRWVETRSESMVGLSHGRGQVQWLELGGTTEGKLLAYRARLLQDGGAYPSIGTVLVLGTRRMAQGTYDIPAVSVDCVGVVTNTGPTSAYRGAGRPEATAAIERAIDVFATEIGMDPAEVRRRNFIAPDAFPFQTHVQHEYDSGDYERALDLAIEAAGYDELRRDQAARRERGDTVQLGIGLASYVEVTSGIPGVDFAAVDTREDGHVVVRTSSGPTGQGHETSWAILVSEQLAVPIEHVHVVFGDTDAIPLGVGTFGSRSLQITGVGVYRAAGEVAERAQAIAADLLEAATEDIVVDPAAGRYYVVGSPFAGISWQEVVAGAPELGELSAEVEQQALKPTFPFGAHVAVVEVDVETGRVDLIRHIAVDDAGTVINPSVFEGQIHGGIAQGAAQALFEHFEYDVEGNPVTTTFATYGIPSAAELPSFELVAMETPTPHNSLGVKGVGESGTIGATPAVQNAVVDALSHLGVRHIDMPISPQAVFDALHAEQETT